MTPPDLSANSTRPASTLQLEWVHGCRGFDCRNNIRYLPSNEPGERSIVFTAASLGVIQTITPHRQQKHFGDHTDDLIAISVFVDLTCSTKCTIATGEMGKTPAIHLWNRDLVSLACMRGTHTKAISQLAHSQDGKFLFSVGLEYSVAVYVIDSLSKQYGKQCCSSQGPKAKILHASSYGSGNTSFVTCGEKHICFWTKSNSGINYQTVNLSRDEKNKIFLSACPVGESGVVVGASDDTLLSFHAASLVVSTSLRKLHPGDESMKEQCISSIWSPPDPSPAFFLVGGKQGFVGHYQITSSHQIVPMATWTLAGAASIRSICMLSDRLLVGTLSCEIIEYKLGSPGTQQLQGEVLNAGHFKNELWGLAVRPLSQLPHQRSREYASVGDDHHLRVFSVEERRQIYSLDMQSMARCCVYSPDGSMLAVGYGGRVGKGKAPNDGMFRVYRMTYDDSGKSSPELPPIRIFEARDAKQAITDMKFSSDNRILAVGSKDNSIYVYSVAQRFKFKFKFSSHKASITHLDLSSDGKSMQSNCGAYELLFCNLSDGKPILRGTTLMNTEWSTWTCSLGWPVQGIWPACADGTDVNAVDRSPGGSLLATGDDHGKVKVFRYPVVMEKSESNLFAGHSSHVTNVRWVPGFDQLPGDGSSEGEDTFLISAGGNDKCLFQWKNVLHEDDSRTARNKVSKSNGGFEEEDSDETEAPSGGDEFMAIKPWKGAIKSPSNFGTPDPTRVVQFQAALGMHVLFNLTTRPLSLTSVSLSLSLSVSLSQVTFRINMQDFILKKVHSRPRPMSRFGSPPRSLALSPPLTPPFLDRSLMPQSLFRTNSSTLAMQVERSPIQMSWNLLGSMDIAGLTVGTMSVMAVVAKPSSTSLPA
jgi:echinoderm microtubule-associated protein-like 6